MDKLNKINKNIVLDISKNIRIEINIYEDMGYPINGWLQSCFNCYHMTSNTKYLKEIKHGKYTYDINVYICKQCSRFFLSNQYEFIKFTDKCNKFIKTKYRF